MTVNTVTHINLRGTARQALEFYRSVSEGRTTLVTYQEAGNLRNPADADNVMWGQVEAADGFRVMAYDVPADVPWNAGENAYFVSLRGDSADEITRLWERLAEGATVMQPLGRAPWSPLYGMLKDRFGVTWVLDVAVQYQAG